MAEVKKRLPSLAPHCVMDRAWIWVCGIDLRGDDNKPTRETLKEIGFRFAREPHLMPDGQTVGHWAHSCERPMFRRRERHKSNRPMPSDPSIDDMADQLKALGL